MTEPDFQPSAVPTPPAGRGATYTLLGVLLIGLLLTAIAAVLALRDNAQTPAAIIPTSVALAAGVPTATFVPDVSGVTPIEPGIPVQDFALPSSTGGDYVMSEQRGRYLLMFFGYASCPDFCPLTLSEFVRVKRALGEEADAVQMVFISVDPARDTPERLTRYLANFDPAFIGVQGEESTLARIAGDYGLSYRLRTDEGENYPVDHTTHSYLIDRDGALRRLYSYGVEPEAIADDIRAILAAEGE